MQRQRQRQPGYNASSDSAAPAQWQRRQLLVVAFWSCADCDWS